MRRVRFVRRGRRTQLIAVLAAAAAMVLTSCSTTKINTEPPQDNGVVLGPAPAGLNAADHFGRSLPALLDQKTAYLATRTDVRVVDTTNGRAIANIRPRNPVLAAAMTQGQPLPVKGKDPSVVWPFPVAAPNGGAAVELVRISTAQHTSTDLLVTLPTWASNAASPPAVTLVGVEGSTLVLGISHSLSHGAMAADLNTGKVLWWRDNFTADALAASTVVGSEPDRYPLLTTHLIGVSLNAGQQVWDGAHAAAFRILPAGPTLVAIDRPSPTGVRSVQLLSAGNGATVGRELPLTTYAPARCLYDQATVTVCTAPSNPEGDATQAVAFDASSGRLLWSMPNWDLPHNAARDGRAPVLTAAWHGTFYGATDLTTIAYSTATGQAQHFLPGPPPLVAGDGIGLALSADGKNVVARMLKTQSGYVPTRLYCTGCEPISHGI